jgi:hypothetical protein
MKLYTLTSNRLTPAPTSVTVDGVTYHNPTQATLRRAGIEAYPLDHNGVIGETLPSPPAGKVTVPTGYKVIDGAWHRTWRYDDAPPPPPVVYSKYRLVRALQAEGVWLQVKEWLQSQEGAWDLYLAAEDISGDEQLLKDGIAEVKKLLGWTDEKVAAVLDAAAIGGAR